MSEKSKRQAAVPAWKIWANPIVLRYARSRLRITGFGVHLMVVMLIAGFIFFAGRAAGVHQLNFDAVGAARVAHGGSIAAGALRPWHVVVQSACTLALI